MTKIRKSVYCTEEQYQVLRGVLLCLRGMDSNIVSDFSFRYLDWQVYFYGKKVQNEEKV